MKLSAITLLSILSLSASTSEPGVHLGRSKSSFYSQQDGPELDLGQPADMQLMELSSVLSLAAMRDEDDSDDLLRVGDFDENGGAFSGSFLDHPEIEEAAASFRTVPPNAWREVPVFFQTSQQTLGTPVASSAKNNLMLVSSYVESIPFSGRVWALRLDKEQDPTLIISDLNKPQGMCYDPTSFSLFVCDIGDGKEGAVYQFHVPLNGEYPGLTLEDGTVVYTGLASDCVIDAYGALYVTDTLSNQVTKVVYQDVHNSATINSVLVKNSVTEKVLSSPSSISTTTDGGLLILNHGGSFDTGLMIYKSLTDDNTDTVSYLNYPVPGRGLAVCGNTAYYISGRTINAVNLDTSEVFVMVKFEKYYTILDVACDENNLYASDNAFGRIYVLPLDGSLRMETVGYVSYARSILLTTEDWAARLVLPLLAFLVLS